MLDSRRDCRYRGGAHRNVGVGLGKVTFHDMSGTSSGIPGFPLTLIHPSAWKVNSRKFGCRILYRETRAQPITLLGLVLRTGSDYDILEGRIKMRWRGYITLSFPYILRTCREMIRSPLQQFYSSFTVDAVNLGEQGRMQRGLDKRISNLC